MSLRLLKDGIEGYRTRGIFRLAKLVYGTKVSPNSVLRAKSFWYRLQGYLAVKDTINLIDIPPERFTHRINTDWVSQPFPKEYSIREGGWDETAEPFEEDPKYKYIATYHEQGEIPDPIGFLTEWDKSRSHRIGYEQLYETIREDGYKTQSELASSGSIFDEINICIGQDGEIIVKHGHHRASIAKVLELETVPVYVRARHSQWQQLRDEIWEAETASTLSERAREHLDHPDMQAAFQRGP